MILVTVKTLDLIRIVMAVMLFEFKLNISMLKKFSEV